MTKALRAVLDKAVPEKVSPEIASLAHNLADTIAASSPDLTEGHAWGYLCFSGRDRVFSILPHKSHVNLQVWRGSELQDRHSILDGDGQSMRHVKVRSAADLGSKAFAKLVDDAVALDQDKE